jgi:hypothetical protein
MHRDGLLNVEYQRRGPENTLLFKAHAQQSLASVHKGTGYRSLYPADPGGGRYSTTACGFRTIRVGKRSSAQNALAANRAAALGCIGLRGIGSSRAVAAIGLCIRRLHPNGHSQDPHACDTGESALHHYSPAVRFVDARLRISWANARNPHAAGDSRRDSLPALPAAAGVAYLMPHVAASAHPAGWFHRAMPPDKNLKAPIRRALGT